MKHSKTIERYAGSPADLAEDAGNLYYDSLAELLTLMSEKLKRDAAADRKRNRRRLAAELAACGTHLEQAAGHIREAWRICEPYMELEKPR
ncbi:MAG: hypothetical protein R3D68_08995 [Hyphomicrobiaceae bacterium]